MQSGVTRHAWGQGRLAHFLIGVTTVGADFARQSIADGSSSSGVWKTGGARLASPAAASRASRASMLVRPVRCARNSSFVMSANSLTAMNHDLLGWALCWAIMRTFSSKMARRIARSSPDS